MVKIQNISKETQAVSDLPAFEAGEIRKVNSKIAYLLLRNPNFKLAKEKPKKQK